jgi:two-component system response regulator MprA
VVGTDLVHLALMSPYAKARILLVEDDKRSARVLARMLVEDGYDVAIASDGAAAIARLSHGLVPDVLCTDLQLPHTSGVCVARYARLVAPGLPVLLTTGYPEQGADIEREFDPRPLILTKPLDYATLERAIRAQLVASDGAAYDGTPTRELLYAS